MSFYAWGDYVSVGEKRRQAQQTLAKLRKQGQSVAPVTIEGRKIAKSFWGQSWCTNLERYSDYEYRLPRGRSYVRNGFVVDLQITKGEITARVSGSDLYNVKIAIAPVKAACWKSICRDCAGTIDSSGRAPARPLGQRRHGPSLSGGRRPVSVAQGNQVVLQLSGLGRHVQTRCGGALWRRRQARRKASASLRAARRG